MSSNDNFPIRDFYNSLVDFLISNNLEQTGQLVGYDISEIANFENQKDIKLPEAYRLFLTNFAMGKPRFFDGQNYKIDSINYFRETAEQLHKKPLSAEIFVFTEWQGYNYDFFHLNSSENPEVTFGIIASDDPNNDQINESSQGSFTNWLCKRIEISLKLRNQLEGLKIDELITELNRLKNIANI